MKKVTLVEVYNANSIIKVILNRELPKPMNAEERERNFKANYRLSKLSNKIKSDIEFTEKEASKIWDKYKEVRTIPSGKEGIKDKEEQFIPDSNKIKYEEEIKALENTESTVEVQPLTVDMASLYNLTAQEINKLSCYIEELE